MVKRKRDKYYEHVQMYARMVLAPEGKRGSANYHPTLDGDRAVELAMKKWKMTRAEFIEAANAYAADGCGIKG